MHVEGSGRNIKENFKGMFWKEIPNEEKDLMRFVKYKKKIDKKKK